MFVTGDSLNSVSTSRSSCFRQLNPGPWLMKTPDKILLAATFAFSCLPALRSATAFPEADVFAFTDRHCSSCHNDVDKEGGLDLTSLKYTPDDPANFQLWVKVHDRVQAGEMPPKEKKRPDATAMGAFVKALNVSLIAADRAVVQRDG